MWIIIFCFMFMVVLFLYVIASKLYKTNANLCFQAYPEYLVTYQIVKPDDSLSGTDESTR